MQDPPHAAAALEVASANARRLGLADRVRFRSGSVPAGEEFDLVLANLPYVAERDWPSLQPEITEWEPREALLAGPDGLDGYRALVPDLAAAPAVGLEVGEGQAEAVQGLLRGGGFCRTEARCDLAGIERLVVGRR